MILKASVLTWKHRFELGNSGWKQNHDSKFKTMFPNSKLSFQIGSYTSKLKMKFRSKYEVPKLVMIFPKYFVFPTQWSCFKLALFPSEILTVKFKCRIFLLTTISNVIIFSLKATLSKLKSYLIISNWIFWVIDHLKFLKYYPNFFRNFFFENFKCGLNQFPGRLPLVILNMVHHSETHKLEN